MKKWFGSSMALLLVAGLLLSACSETENAASSNASTTSTTENTADNSAALQEAAVQDGLIQASDKSKNPAAATSRKDTLIVGLQAPEGVFNPYFYHNGYDGNVSSAMFAPLVDLNSKGEPTPILAEKWDITPDNLTYTFHLRQGLKYSDGSPVTADDVAFTLTLLYDKAYDGETDITLTHIKGGQAYKEGKAATIEGIKVIDPLTVQITTEQVSAKSLLALGGPVLSKAYYGKGYKQGQLDYIKELFGKPMGAGPYKLVKFIPGQEVRFEANENYYEGKPAIQNFIYKFTTTDTNLQLFQAGETDSDGFTANPDTFEQLKQLGFANIDIYPANNYAYIDFNHKKPLFQDKKVRQAFVYGLDRQTIVDSIYQGYGSVANIPASPVSWAYTDDVNPYKYDQEKAKQLLDEAGWKTGSDGIREKDGKKLKVIFSASKPNALIDIMKENYKEIGIDLEAEVMDFNALVTKKDKGDYDMVTFSTSILMDPSEGVEDFYSKGKSKLGYSNPKVDELIEKGLSTLDVEQRKPIYTELFKLLNDEVPFIFLWNRKVMSAHNARLVGYKPDSYTGLSAMLPKVKIEE